MTKPIKLIALAVIICGLAASSVGTSAVHSQAEFTLKGEWIVTSKPINGQMASPNGVSLGFPDRDMIFEQDGDLRTGVVLREDVGENVHPLGVWRIDGDKFSATFQLWCPNANGPCGSIVMRGQFVDDNKIKGTMAAFFNLIDERTPTGYDTWNFSFVGNRVGGGAN